LSQEILQNFLCWFASGQREKRKGFQREPLLFGSNLPVAEHVLLLCQKFLNKKRFQVVKWEFERSVAQRKRFSYLVPKKKKPYIFFSLSGRKGLNVL
jgi:hypothetical protein